MDTFDYIIVGAGSAGCLLANRLSADPGKRVLLLEAGGRDTHPNIHIPAAFYKLFRQKEDWNFQTTPQPHMKGRPMYQPRGKVLGGSSSINAMIYIRGHRFDYDSWAALGNRGWSYEEVLPYFRKFERNLEFADEFHGREGELTVSPPASPHPLSRTLLEAAHQAGYPLNADFNGSRQEGFGFFQLTIRDGRRCSAADAFLRPVAGRPNLSVETNALAHRLLFEQGRARGLLYERAGRQIEVAARGEIILSAGAFGSPQLLLLSGVGDAQQLRELGIPVLHHLPGVGRNLHDHLLAGVSYHCTQPITMDGADRWPRLAPNLLRYLLNRKGPFASNVAECGGFLRSEEGLEAPDLQFHFAPAYYLRHAFENPRSGHGFGLGPTLIAPHSRGSLRLAGPDPHLAPLIDPGYFSDERDLRTLMRGCEIADQILRQPAFDAFRGPLFMPPRELQEESEVMDYLRQWSETLYHPVGTCRMGADEEAVVDAELRVHGLQGLRVADASIMPLIVRGNTNAPTMMIAEKAAAHLLAEKVA